ncbi:Cation-transporting P-type ATPase [Syntrophomonas zehnderi OL-4]|uniref:P-type Ca(2+) transporter n=1 Tax=Syntrophomonas zehnderi OL-4 TaxID=690567 RepID=A0A0E4GCY0_9FIRM|nr:calcium-translocating P-type ATPase, PMCA-type [Syntrophomonas zehnderi]CFX29279.1 Cation-transporting P-type ATPase [Syntrophomonas zehnderi OL-4]
MIPHNCSYDEVLKQFQVNSDSGLSAEDASNRLAQYGLNKLEEGKRKSNLQRFGEQFADVMIIILLIAAAISFTVAWYEGKGFFEPFLILLVVVLNAIIGVVQEGKAEKALDALKDLSAPHARVIRDGKEMVIEAFSLVPGDIISLNAGDYVPADARIIRSASLKSEESALTGESVPSEKDGEALSDASASLGDRINMVYSGCSITSGTARAVVVSTGMNTEMGKIARLLDAEGDTRTPLQHKLAEMGKYIGFMAVGICVIIFIIGLVYGMNVMEIFMIAVALAVSAIPEGLPAIVTIVLAVGVQRMVKKNAIIRKLPAVETLGSASVICSDKTGTLTQNQMTLVKAFDAASETIEDISTANSPVIKKLLKYATLCSDGTVEFEDGRECHIGDPTETSIVMAAYKNGLTKADLNRLYPRQAELPFDSERKLMSTVNIIDGKNIVIVKGAIDVLAGRCIAGNVEAGRKHAEELSRQALRILAVAWKEIDTIPAILTSEELENGLTFMGLVGMIDPPRPEAREAVAVCRKAGIKPVMITGDHVVTAAAIAKDLGILLDGDDAINGTELLDMTDAELKARVPSVSVYARVSPEDKIRIVRAWQGHGAVVSMTGDGVNDAPALKAADIGCAMGITGTDVAKGASDMILTDDNFATIVDAVHQGRGIYDNIKKTVGFLLGTNIGEVLTVFVAMLVWQASPLLAVHLLWINLVTDSLPAIALGMEPVEKDVMERKPRPKGENIFAHGYGIRILLQGTMFAMLTLTGFLIAWQSTGDITSGRTMAFIVLAVSQVIHAFNMRSDHSLFATGIFTNPYLNGAALISFSLISIIVLVPSVTNAFSLTQLPVPMYILALGLALVPVVVLELSKAFGLVRHQHQ